MIWHFPIALRRAAAALPLILFLQSRRPRGLQLRVSYFEGARLFAPMMPANRIARSSLP